MGVCVEVEGGATWFRLFYEGFSRDKVFFVGGGAWVSAKVWGVWRFRGQRKYTIGARARFLGKV